jgi:hypothetical protein
MIYRLITLCLLLLAWVFMAPAAFAHGNHSSLSSAHDHNFAVHAAAPTEHQHSSLSHEDLKLQPECVNCSGDHDPNHNCECCFPGNHHYTCQLSAVALNLRRSVLVMRLSLAWQVPDGQNPSGLERPPKI